MPDKGTYRAKRIFVPLLEIVPISDECCSPTSWFGSASLPDRIVWAAGCDLPAITLAGREVTHLVPRAELDCDFVIDTSKIKVVVRGYDLEGAPGVDAIPTPEAGGMELVS